MATLNWEITDTDAALIRKIADRAMSSNLGRQLRDNDITHLDVTMSVQACHANGNPLDLAALLEFPPFDFSHDIGGIIGHLNHDTGKLENFFSPRCTDRIACKRHDDALAESETICMASPEGYEALRGWM